jgi:hypothetical protein
MDGLRRTWWFSFTLLFGLASWAVFLFAGLRAGKRAWVVAGVVYLAVAAVLVVLLRTPPEDSTANGVAAAGMLALAAVSFVHALRIRGEYLRRAAARPALGEDVGGEEGPEWLRRQTREQGTPMPRWVVWLWSTPARRLAFAGVLLALGGWILVAAVTDPAGFFAESRSAGGFVAAPALVLLAGLWTADAVRDLVRRENRGHVLAAPVHAFLGSTPGKAVAGLYVAAMVVLLSTAF